MTNWYDEEDPEEVGKLFDKRVYALEQDQVPRIRNLTKIASVYQNQDVLRDLSEEMPRMILNLTQTICDGVIAKQVVNESKATFDVSDGDWDAKLKSDQLDRFVQGETYRIKQLEQHELALKDAVAWSGDGWVYYHERDKKVACERVNPLEMLIDVRASVSGAPRDLFRVRYITKELACAMYNEQADEIYELPTQEPPYPYPWAPNSGSYEDNHLVRLAECWHLPETDEGDDGRYIFACGNVVLADKKWSRPRFPFVRISYSKDVMGGYSISLGQQLYPLHLELNKIKRNKLIGLSIWGLPRIYQQRGSTISPELGIEAGLIYHYTGSKPETDQSPCYSAELAQEEQNLSNQMYQIGGISPLERGADMPSRVDSRPGLREYIAASDEKHAAISLAWNRSFLEGAQQIIDVAREIPDYEAFGRAKDFVSRIKFKDCALEDWRFQIKLVNGNFLPNTPSGKRMVFLDYLRTPYGGQDPTMILEMMFGDHPDVDAILDKKTAGKRLIERQLYEIVHNKRYMAPDTVQANDIALAQQMCSEMQKTVLIQSNNGTDLYTGETIKDVRVVQSLLDKYWTALDDLGRDVAAAQQAQQGAQNAGSGQPAGPPAATPAQPAAPGGAAGPQPIAQPVA